MEILKLEHLTKAFGELRAVNDLSTTFQGQQITAVIGPNGAGKSTLFNLITGKLPPTSGSVHFKEEEITHMPPFELVKKGIGRSFQITNIFNGLTTFENIRIGVLAHKGIGFELFSNVDAKSDVNEEIETYLGLVGLSEQRDVVAGIMSHGDQKRLEIALTLTSEPELLLLDEPTAGMPSDETRSITNLIRDIAEKRKLTVILTEHDMDVVFSICERILVMQYGSLIADGDEQSIKSDKRVREAYLGEEE